MPSNDAILDEHPFVTHTGTNPESHASQLYAVGDVVAATGFIAAAAVGASQIVLFAFSGNVLDRSAGVVRGRPSSRSCVVSIAAPVTR